MGKMSDGTDVAIIIPVYNAKRYIRQCIKSILRQSYTGWRIVAVDDGSTDGSSNILDEIACTDKRIFVIHQENKGSIEARKTGALSENASECEWITFVDADDLFHEDAIEKMYNVAVREQADLVCGAMERMYKGITLPTVSPPCFRIETTKIYTHDEFIEKLFVGYFGISDFPVNLCGKMFRSRFVKEAFKHTPDIKFTGDDLCITIQIVVSVHKIAIIPDKIYKYRIGGGTSKVSRDVIDDFVILYNFKKEFAEHFSMPQDIQRLMDIEMINIAKDYLERFVCQFGYDKNIVNKEIKRVCFMNEFHMAAERLLDSKFDNKWVRWIADGDYDMIREYLTTDNRKKRIKQIIKSIIYKI